jgi:hypothetical protein
MNFKIQLSPSKKANKKYIFEGKEYSHMLPHEMEEIVWSMIAQVK